MCDPVKRPNEHRTSVACPSLPGRESVKRSAAQGMAGGEIKSNIAASSDAATPGAAAIAAVFWRCGETRTSCMFV